MKKLGLIGGMSWESTQTYYRRMNEIVRERLGGLHSAECLLYSVDFSSIEIYQKEGKWEEAGQYLAQIAQKLEGAGADGIVLCTNTMHKVSNYIDAAINIPFIHIADVTGHEINHRGHRKMLLLGTKYTMEQPFLKERLTSYGANISIPNVDERDEVNRIIFEELCKGDIRDSSVDMVKKLLLKHEKWGIQGVILGCTELGLIVKIGDVQMDVIDTTEIHVKSAVEFMLSK